MAGAKPSGEQETEYGLRILDFASFYHLQCAGKQHRVEIQEFIRLVFSLTSGQSGCHEDMDFFVREARSRIHREQMIALLCRASRLLLQLPDGAIARILPGIEPSRWDLVQ